FRNQCGLRSLRKSPSSCAWGEASLALLWTENASNGRSKPLPLVSLFHQLLAAARGERIKASLTIIAGNSPFRRHPSAFFETLQRRIECPVFDKKFFVRCLLNGAGDSLPMLRT